MGEESIVFIRHSGGGFLGEEWSQSWLFSDDDGVNRVGIHFQDYPSFVSDPYTIGETRIERFDKAGKEPTIAVVSFSDLPSGEKYLSKIVPESHEIVVMDKEEKSIVEVFESEPTGNISNFPEEYKEDGKDRYEVVKTLRVEDWETAYHEEHRLLWQWHSQPTIHEADKNSQKKNQYIRDVYHDNEKSEQLQEFLDSGEDELIAEKFLRYNLFAEKEFRLDAPRGEYMENIDILGSVDGEEGIEKVVASVTSSSSSHRESRIKDINEYSDRRHTFFFDSEDERPSGLENGVTHVSLSEVVDWMSEDTRHQRSLDVMLGDT